MHAFKRERNVGVALPVRQAGNEERSAYIEAVLVAPQQAFVAAVLGDLMRHGIQQIIAEILEETAMPVAQDVAGGALFAVSSARRPRFAVWSLNSSMARCTSVGGCGVDCGQERPARHTSTQIAR